MTYNEQIDEKYAIIVAESGTVSITRHGDTWLENPQGSKAWISVADKLEQNMQRIADLEADNARLKAAFDSKS